MRAGAVRARRRIQKPEAHGVYRFLWRCCCFCFRRGEGEGEEEGEGEPAPVPVPDLTLALSALALLVVLMAPAGESESEPGLGFFEGPPAQLRRSCRSMAKAAPMTRGAMTYGAHKGRNRSTYTSHTRTVITP